MPVSVLIIFPQHFLYLPVLYSAFILSLSHFILSLSHLYFIFIASLLCLVMHKICISKYILVLRLY